MSLSHSAIDTAGRQNDLSSWIGERSHFLPNASFIQLFADESQRIVAVAPVGFANRVGKLVILACQADVRGAIGGKYPRVDFDNLTRGTVRVYGNTYKPNPIGFDPVRFADLAKAALKEKLIGGFTRSFLGGVFQNLPPKPEICLSGDPC
jgi:hypothetical protein